MEKLMTIRKIKALLNFVEDYLDQEIIKVFFTV